MSPRLRDRGSMGFTLIELLVVMGIIVTVLAVAFPQLLPVIAFSKHEGVARHLASYGRNAMGQASLFGEHYTVYVDLDAQEYYTMRWPKPGELDREGAGVKEYGGGEGSGEVAPKSSQELVEAMMMEESGEKSGLNLEDQTYELLDRFDAFHRQKLLALSENVVHDDDFLADVGPEFNEDSPFGIADSDLEPQEVDDPLLTPTYLPRNIWIDSIRVGDDEITSGMVEIDINTSGMTQTVIFYIVNEDDEYYTVTWDAVTGAARLVSGREASQ